MDVLSDLSSVLMSRYVLRSSAINLLMYAYIPGSSAVACTCTFLISAQYALEVGVHLLFPPKLTQNPETVLLD